MPAPLLSALAAAALLTLGAGSALAAKDLPQETPEGLVLRKGKVADAVYVRPGVDFSIYNRVAILECPVAFRKDWQKDQQRAGKRVKTEDMEEIKAGLSAEFRKIFSRNSRPKAATRSSRPAGRTCSCCGPPSSTWTSRPRTP